MERVTVAAPDDSRQLSPSRVPPLRKLLASPRRFSAALAGLLVLLTFADVFFVGTSLRMTDQLWGFYQNSPLYRAHPPLPCSTPPNPRPPGRRQPDLFSRFCPGYTSGWLAAYSDFGGAVWQSEPMMEFMRSTLWTLNSPYWNPYSSAGSLGPETLVDLKFSVLTLAYAVLGGGAVVYNLVLLAAFWLGAYFIVRLAREKLRLGGLGCLAAGIFYLLNGYSAANIGSNVALSYLFIPACLYASFSLIDEPTRRRFAWLTLAFAALLSFTFLPTTIIATATILACAPGYLLVPRRGGRDLARRALSILLLHGLALASAVALLAVLYLPLTESLTITGILDLYKQRTFYPAFWSGALSLITPSHFFASYGTQDPIALAVTGNTIYHLGALGLGLAACAWDVRSRRWRPLVLTCVGIIAIALGWIFAVPGISHLIGSIPVARSIGCQYLWPGVVVPLNLLVGVGVENLRRGTAARVPTTLVAVGAVVAAARLWQSQGAPSSRGTLLDLATPLALGLGCAAVVWLAPRMNEAPRAAAAALLVGLMSGELAVYARWFRFRVEDRFAEPTSEVTFLKSHAGHHRVMTLGTYAATMDRGSAYQLQEVTSLNMGTLPGYRVHFAAMTRSLPAQYRWGDFVSLAIPQDATDLGYYDWQAVSLLGVKYVVVPKTSPGYLAAFPANGFPLVHESEFTAVFQNPRVLPRAFSVELAAAAAQQEVTLPPTLSARIEPVEITRYRNAEIGLQGSAPAPSLVVLTDNWHPNWRAWVGGSPAPILRVNGTFRGVRVPAGDFTIEMSYRPRTLPAALAITAIALLALLALLVGRRPA